MSVLKCNEDLFPKNIITLCNTNEMKYLKSLPWLWADISSEGVIPW